MFKLCHITNIPVEVLYWIANYLDPKIVIFLRKTCYYMYATLPIKYDDNVLTILVKRGEMKLLTQIPNKYPHDIKNWKLCAIAALGGHLDALIWLRNLGYRWNVDTCCNASKNGHLHVLQPLALMLL